MSKMLVPLFTALLYFAAAEALVCNKCIVQQPNTKCTEGDMCQANPGESCYTRKLYLANTIVSAEVGCIKNCRDYFVGLYIQHFFSCCTQDFCNA